MIKITQDVLSFFFGGGGRPAPHYIMILFMIRFLRRQEQWLTLPFECFRLQEPCISNFLFQELHNLHSSGPNQLSHLTTCKVLSLEPYHTCIASSTNICQIIHSDSASILPFLYTAIARTLIGGVFIHIFMFCPTSFFWNQIQIYQFEKKLVGQNMNIWINIPLLTF